MSSTPHQQRDATFAGSVPELYESHMVPLIFAPYADDMARRAAALSPRRVLETAAGTGVVTRALARALPSETEITATDLNPPMLARAQALGTVRPVQWQLADAQALPFDDASFDLVVCQFGAMFFPDDPPRFMARTPHGYSDIEAIRRDVAAGGFTEEPRIETVARRSRAPSPLHPAVAICQGTPMRDEIVKRGGEQGLDAATRAAEALLSQRYGAGEIESWIQAHVVTVTA